MILYLLMISVPILGLIAFLAHKSSEKKSYSKVQFFAKGKDAGFSFKEIEMLRQLAKKSELEDPVSLFWSVKQLDLCIKSFLKKIQLTGEERNQETQDFLSKLYEYRKKIEMEQPRYKLGIKSSRSISETQHLRILIDGLGVFKAQVKRNSDRFLTINKPSNSQLPPNFVWKGQKLAIYFWRKEDAGYVFDTYVLDEALSGNSPVLHLAHSDSLFRTQKRKNIRRRTHKSAYLYLPKDTEVPEQPETEPGLRCIIEDLSESGCAVVIGGRARDGLKVKIQFELDSIPVVMNGTVRSSEYDDKTNRSLLHIEADPLSIKTRNLILAEVFGVRPQDEYLEAFSLYDQEALFGETEENAENNTPNQSISQDGPLKDIGGPNEAQL